MTTKSYVSGAAYFNRVSDYCNHCQFKPEPDCPFTNLYGAFLARHRALLKHNPRLEIPIASLQRRPEELQRYDDVVYRSVQERLLSGEAMSPENLP
jgi:deoxyribodipyrimidine photolyase-related protein